MAALTGGLAKNRKDALYTKCTPEFPIDAKGVA